MYIMGILAIYPPPKLTPPKKEGLIKGLLTIGFPFSKALLTPYYWGGGGSFGGGT